MNTYGALVEIMTDENQSTTRKTYRSATLPTTKPTWTGLILQEQRHMIKPLRRDKASIMLISHTKGSYLFRKLDFLTPIKFITQKKSLRL